MKGFLFLELLLFLKVASATPLAAPSSPSSEIAPFLLRSVLPLELRRREGSPLGTTCTNIYNVNEHTYPISPSLICRLEHCTDFRSNKERGNMTPNA